MQVASTLDYCDMATITAIKRFIVQATGGKMIIFSNFDLVKNHQIVKNSTNTKASEKEEHI